MIRQWAGDLIAAVIIAMPVIYILVNLPSR